MLAILDKSDNQLRKNVAAIHTTGSLTLLERKLVNVLLLNAYDELLTKKTHSLRVTYLNAMLGWSESNNNALLKKSLHNIVTTPIEFNLMEDGKETWEIMTMLSFGNIKQGVCSYSYAHQLAEKLYDPEIYAMINIGIQKRFSGSNALSLYENCIRYKSVGSTGWWEIEKFRKLIGVDSIGYDEFKYLKRDVILKSIKEINKVSDIFIDAEYKKQGRSISYVRFLIKDNPQRTLLSPEISDEFATIRETEAYKKLKDHGIGDRLAINWLNNDKEGTEKIIEYVESQDKKKNVRGTTAGFIRSLVENKIVIGNKTQYEINKDKENKNVDKKELQLRIKEKQLELKSEYKRTVINKLIESMKDKDKKEYIERYKLNYNSNQLSSFDYEKMEFKDSIQRVSYIAWLRSELSKEININNSDFEGWLKDKMCANSPLN